MCDSPGGLAFKSPTAMKSVVEGWISVEQSTRSVMGPGIRRGHSGVLSATRHGVENVHNTNKRLELIGVVREGLAVAL